MIISLGEALLLGNKLRREHCLFKMVSALNHFASVQDNILFRINFEVLPK